MSHLFGYPVWSLGLAYFLIVSILSAWKAPWLRYLLAPSAAAVVFAASLQVNAWQRVHGFCPACFLTFCATAALPFLIARASQGASDRASWPTRWATIVVSMAAVLLSRRPIPPQVYSLSVTQTAFLNRLAPEPIAPSGPKFVVFSDLGCPACYEQRSDLARMRGSGRLIVVFVAKHPGEGPVLGSFLYLECLRRNEAWLFLERIPDTHTVDEFCHLALKDIGTTTEAIRHFRPDVLKGDRLFDAIGTGQTPSVFRWEGGVLTRDSSGPSL